MPDKAQYGPDEHEALLQHIEQMHHETRAQTIARLKAAIGHKFEAEPAGPEQPAEPKKKPRVRRQKRG